MANSLAGHTNTYHTYGFEEALDGIAGAGFRYVELTAVPGWTEHVILDSKPAEVRDFVTGKGLEAVSLSGHSDLTTREGLEHGIKAVKWAAEYGVPIMNTAVGGHQSADESEIAFLNNVGELADAADAEGIVVALEIHGDIMASSDVTIPLWKRSAATPSRSTMTRLTSSSIPVRKPSTTCPRSSPISPMSISKIRLAARVSGTSARLARNP